jgi:predicted DNA-binding transcriptional regulator AlpA
MQEQSDNDGATAAGSVLFGWVEQIDLARQLDVSEATLRRWMAQRTGPPHVKIGRRVIYNVESVREWLRSREVNPKRKRGHGDQ